VRSDFDLLRSWRAGDERAGRELVERHFASVYRFFANKSSTDVDDLVQQTFLACLEGRDRIAATDDEAAFRRYLFGVARKRLYRRFRDGARAPERDTVSGLVADQPTPADALARREEQKLLLLALRRLPLELQVLLELFYWEGLPDREIAELFGTPLGTLKSRLRKGRHALEAAMAELARDGALLASTVEGFDRWVAELRADLRVTGAPRR
jgi:RNA polymerase sigma-70 factor (ECF subfamily)